MARRLCGDAGTSSGAFPLAQQLRQLGEVRRHAAVLVAGEQLGHRAPTGSSSKYTYASACPVASLTMKRALLCSSIGAAGSGAPDGTGMIADRLVANRMDTAARRCVLLLIRFRPPCWKVRESGWRGYAN